MISQSLLRKNIVFGYAAQAVTMASVFFLSVALVRLLSKSDFGAYNLINSLILVLGAVCSLGLESTTSRYISEFLSRNELTKVNRIFLRSLVIRAAALGTCCLAIFLFSEQLTELLNLPPAIMVSLAVIMGVFVLNQLRPVVGAAPLQGYLETYKNSSNVIVYQLLRLVLFILVLVMGYGLTGLFLTWLVVEALSLMAYTGQVAPKLIYNSRNGDAQQVTKSDLNRFDRYAWHMYISQSLLVFTTVAIDNFVIAHYLPYESIAEYSLAAGLVLMIGNVNPILVMRGLITNVMVREYAVTGDRQKLSRNYSTWVKLILFAMLPLYMVFVLYIDKIISIVYSPEYLSIIPVALTLVGFFVFREINQAFSPIILATETTWILVLASMFSVYNLVMDIVLVPRFGIMGAAIATGSAFFFLFIYFTFMLRKTAGCPIVFPLLGATKVAVNLLPMVGIGLLMREVISGLASLLLAILVTLLGYLLSSIVFKVFSDDERERMQRLLGTKFFMF